MYLRRVLQTLVIFGACLYAALPAKAGGGVLKVSFLSIGQGDSIYVEAPNGNQMIIDGGPDGSLLDPLSEAVPFGDRSINVIMVTNPDVDHYAGFLDVLKQYSIGAVVEPGTLSGTPTHQSFQKAIFAKHIPEIVAHRGTVITLDKENGVTFTVLYPDRDVSSFTTNDGSLVGILQYGTTKVLFTGDATQRSESIILAENSPESLKSDILKVGHHGSPTSSSDAFVSAVSPKYAVISAGKHNKYGLPKQITLDTLAAHDIQVLRTDEKGTITFISDGNSYQLTR